MLFRSANHGDGTAVAGPLEIVSLVGTLSADGCHLHASVSNGEGRTSGGHLLEGCPIYTTAEVVIGDGVAAYGATLPAGVIRRGHPALATAVARLGWRAAQRGETIDPAHIQPLYIRRPDVEIARDARRAAPR